MKNFALLAIILCGILGVATGAEAYFGTYAAPSELQVTGPLSIGAYEALTGSRQRPLPIGTYEATTGSSLEPLPIGAYEAATGSSRGPLPVGAYEALTSRARRPLPIGAYEALTARTPRPLPVGAHEALRFGRPFTPAYQPYITSPTVPTYSYYPYVRNINYIPQQSLYYPYY